MSSFNVKRSKLFTVIYFLLVAIMTVIGAAAIGYFVGGPLSMVLAAMWGCSIGVPAALYYLYGNPFASIYND